jgi:hypothetical protein
MSTISAGTSSGTALVTSGDTTGQLVLQTNGTTTAVTIGTNQVVTLAQPLPVASGGTGSTSGLNLASAVTGTLGVANGGTGAASLTANNVLLGNGTSAVQVVAPGTAGNVLTSNGTTWQSTAPAPSAGSITATASGAITAGNPVVVNSNGTVSSVAITYASSLSNLNNISSSYAPGSTVIQQAATYDPNGFIVLFYGNSNNYPTVVIGTPSGSSITWGTPTVLTSSATVTASYKSNSVYASTANAHMYFTCNSFGELYYSSIRVNSVGGISIIQGGSYLGFGSYYIPSVQTSFLYDPTTNRLAYIFSENNNASTYALGGICDTSGFYYQQYLTAVDTAGISPGLTAAYFDTSAARGLIFWENANNRLWARTAVLNNGSISLGASVSVTSVNNNGYGIAVGKEASGSGYLFVYISGSTYTARYATVSGSTITLGSTGGSWGSFSFPASFLSYGSRSLFFSGSTSVSVTVSGGVPSATSYGNLGSNNYPQYWLLDSLNVRLVQVYSSSSNVTGYAVGTGATSNLTSSNLIGFSSASYSNGQTATINTVGSSNNNQSGMTAGNKYYVTNTGTLSVSATSQPYAGVSLSATNILVKG